MTTRWTSLHTVWAICTVVIAAVAVPFVGLLLDATGYFASARALAAMSLALGIAAALIMTSPFLVIGYASRGVNRERQWADLCPQCGYDLAGLRSDVCPECGRGISAGAGSELTDKESPP